MYATQAWIDKNGGNSKSVKWLELPFPTMAAAIAIKYGRALKLHPQLRSALHVFLVASLVAAGIAGFFGAMLNKNAPVEGGQTVHLVQGEKP